MSTPDTSTGRLFKGQRLNRYTARREQVASDMGLRLHSLTPADIISEKITVPVAGSGKKLKAQEVEISYYREIGRDAKLVVWLCLQPESKIAHIEEAGARGIEEARSEMWRWADSNGVKRNSEMEGLCIKLWVEIINQVDEARTEPVPQDENANGDEDEPSD